MRKSNWTPSIVPRGPEQDVYLVIERFWQSGPGLAGSRLWLHGLGDRHHRPVGRPVQKPDRSDCPELGRRMGS